MRVRRLLFCAVAVGLVSATGAATAAPRPKPLCNLLVDDKDDGDWDVVPAVSSPALDIQSGDIATGRNELVAVLRVGSTNTSSDNASLIGFRWDFGATAGGVDYSFWVRRGAGPSRSESHGVTVGATNLTSTQYTFKVEGNSFVWRFKRNVTKDLAKPRLVFVDFRGNSSAFSSTADVAFTKTSKYPDRALSCVRAA